MSAAEDFAQYKLQFVDYIQHDYEVIRPIVLFAETIAERSRQTGIERTSVGDKARRFVQEGMLGLVDHRIGQAGRKGHVYPEAVAAYKADGTLPTYEVIPYKNQPVSATNPKWSGEVIPQDYSPINGDAGDASTVELEWSCSGEPVKSITPTP